MSIVDQIADEIASIKAESRNPECIYLGTQQCNDLMEELNIHSRPIEYAGLPVHRVFSHDHLFVAVSYRSQESA